MRHNTKELFIKRNILLNCVFTNTRYRNGNVGRNIFANGVVESNYVGSVPSIAIQSGTHLE